MTKTAKTRRRFLLVPAGAVAAVLLLASAAVACTAVSTATATITSINHKRTSTGCTSTATDCAAPNDEITVSATGVGAEPLPVPRQWFLYFLNFEGWTDTHSCMGLGTSALPEAGSHVVIGGPVASSGGNIPATTGAIPTTARNNDLSVGDNARVCFIESRPQTGPTNDALLGTATGFDELWIWGGLL